MRKFFLFSVGVVCIFICNAQKKLEDRLFINAGAGPSYSLFYSSGGWVRDFGAANFNNVTEKRTAWAFSHFAELEWRLRNSRWSLRGGYSMHHFYPAVNIEGTSSNNTFFSIHTQEADRYTYYQLTAHYAFLNDGANRIEVGTGFYIQDNRRQGIEFYEGTTPVFIINDYKSQEAGFPINLDYLRLLKNGNAIGARFNFNYTQSVQTAEHVALQFYVKAKLR